MPVAHALRSPGEACRIQGSGGLPDSQHAPRHDGKTLRAFFGSRERRRGSDALRLQRVRGDEHDFGAGDRNQLKAEIEPGSIGAAHANPAMRPAGADVTAQGRNARVVGAIAGGYARTSIDVFGNDDVSIVVEVDTEVLITDCVHIRSRHATR